MLCALGEDSEVKDVFLLAHSTGAVVAYEALAILNDANGGHGAALAREKARAFITIGAILNMAWNSAIVSEHARFRRPIPPHVRWYNLWTRYDYGAAGDIDIAERPWLHATKLVNRRVSNYESLLLDHTAYWRNQEQVISLLLEELGGLDDGNDFWRGPGERSLRPPDPGQERQDEDLVWRSRSYQTWEDFNFRRGAVARLASSRLPVLALALVVLPGALLLFLEVLIMPGWGRNILYSLGLGHLPLIPSSFGPDGRFAPPLGDRSLMAGLFAVALVIAGLVPTGLYHGAWWLWWRRWVRPRAEARHRAFREWRTSGRPPRPPSGR